MHPLTGKWLHRSAISVVCRADELNFGELRKLLTDLDGSDPFWKFRRAALLCDLGDMKGARETAHIGLREIRESFYRDRDSLWTISRLAWAQFLSRGLRSWTMVPRDEPSQESEILRLRFFETDANPGNTCKQSISKLKKTFGALPKGREPRSRSLRRAFIAITRRLCILERGGRLK